MKTFMSWSPQGTLDMLNEKYIKIGVVDFDVDAELRKSYLFILGEEASDDVTLKIDGWSDRESYILAQKISAWNLGCPVGIFIPDNKLKKILFSSDEMIFIKDGEYLFHNKYPCYTSGNETTDVFIIPCTAHEKKSFVCGKIYV